MRRFKVTRTSPARIFGCRKIQHVVVARDQDEAVERALRAEEGAELIDVQELPERRRSK